MKPVIVHSYVPILAVQFFSYELILLFALFSSGNVSDTIDSGSFAPLTFVSTEIIVFPEIVAVYTSLFGVISTPFTLTHTISYPSVTETLKVKLEPFKPSVVLSLFIIANSLEVSLTVIVESPASLLTKVAYEFPLLDISNVFPLWFLIYPFITTVSFT